MGELNVHFCIRFSLSRSHTLSLSLSTIRVPQLTFGYINHTAIHYWGKERGERERVGYIEEHIPRNTFRYIRVRTHTAVFFPLWAALMIFIQTPAGRHENEGARKTNVNGFGERERERDVFNAFSRTYQDFFPLRIYAFISNLFPRWRCLGHKSTAGRLFNNPVQQHFFSNSNVRDKPIRSSLKRSDRYNKMYRGKKDIGRRRKKRLLHEMSLSFR